MGNRRKLSVGQEHEFLDKLEDAFLNEEEAKVFAQAVVQSKGNEMAKRVIAFVHRGGHSESANQVLARYILGKDNLWGPEDWIGLGYPEKLLKKVPEIPWGPEELEEVKNTHFLHLGMETLPDGKTPLTVMALHEQKLPVLAPVWVDEWLKDKDPITKETLSRQWYLTKKEIVENSTSKTYDAQLPLLNKEKEEPPSTNQEVQKSLLYQKKTGKRLNPAFGARTRDFVGSEDVVVVSHDHVFILDVDSSCRDGSWNGLGLGASRKSDAL